VWRDHLKVPAVKGGDLVQVEPWLAQAVDTTVHAVTVGGGPALLARAGEDAVGEDTAAACG
jgi:hypothetical protein